MNTNIVNQLSDPALVEGVAKSLMGDWIWLFVAGVAVLLFREIIQEFAAGLGVYFSRQWAVDEIVYLNGRQARIARIGMVETTFYTGTTPQARGTITGFWGGDGQMAHIRWDHPYFSDSRNGGAHTANLERCKR